MNPIAEMQKVSCQSASVQMWYWKVMNKKFKKILLLKKRKWLIK
jgi:hypothetical protein